MGIALAGLVGLDRLNLLDLLPPNHPRSRRAKLETRSLKEAVRCGKVGSVPTLWLLALMHGKS